MTAAAADDEEKVRARTIPRPRGRAPKRASATGSLSPGRDANVSARAIERSIHPPRLTLAPRAFPPPRTQTSQVPFGYTRQDVLLIGVGTTAAGFALYYGLQAGGVSAIWAGNIVQLTFVGGLSIAWVASYVLRVMNKDMTYVKQLKDYEDAVMAKRLEELPEAELEKMMDDISKLDPK